VGKVFGSVFIYETSFSSWSTSVLSCFNQQRVTLTKKQQLIESGKRINQRICGGVKLHGALMLLKAFFRSDMVMFPSRFPASPSIPFPRILTKAKLIPISMNSVKNLE
jgi:hypothetical protein